MELECQLAGSRAALQTLLSIENTLHGVYEQQQSLLEELHKKRKRIEEYSSRTVRISATPFNFPFCPNMHINNNENM